MCLSLRASSRCASVSLHVGCGRYLPGLIGMKLQMFLPNTVIAGDNLVVESGVFLYWSTARWNWSISMSPLSVVLSVMRRFMVLTPISALVLLCGKATDDSLWWTPPVFLGMSAFLMP